MTFRDRTAHAGLSSSCVTVRRTMPQCRRMQPSPARPQTMPATPPTPETFLGIPKLPARYAAVVLPLFLSVLMTFIVSLVSTLRGIGLTQSFPGVWLSAWGLSWLIAFPTLLVALPLVRRATRAIVRAA